MLWSIHCVIVLYIPVAVAAVSSTTDVGVGDKGVVVGVAATKVVDDVGGGVAATKIVDDVVEVTKVVGVSVEGVPVVGTRLVVVGTGSAVVILCATTFYPCLLQLTWLYDS